MKINSIDNLGYVISVEKAGAKQRVNPDKNSRKDKLELSEEAKKMAQSRSGLTAERYDLIKQRIAEKFYDQDEIMQEIATRMLKSPEIRNLLNHPGTGKQS